MRLGIIGRGYWGNTYAQTLEAMEIPYWQAGRDSREWKPADGIIIASEGKSHYSLAKQFIAQHVPVLIEKPVCMNIKDANNLLKLAEYTDALVFTGHTHLYSPAWREFKERAKGITAIHAKSGGPCKLTQLWDWGPHDVAMCIDLMGVPKTVDFGRRLNLTWGEVTAEIRWTKQPVERVFEVSTENGPLRYMAPKTNPSALEVLIGEFVAAIDYGAPSIKGLRLGVSVVRVLDLAEDIWNELQEIA